MPQELAAAICLVFVIEGLLLFAAPAAWKRMVSQMLDMSDRQIRMAGAAGIMLGLIALLVVRGMFN